MTASPLMVRILWTLAALGICTVSAAGLLVASHVGEQRRCHALEQPAPQGRAVRLPPPPQDGGR